MYPVLTGLPRGRSGAAPPCLSQRSEPEHLAGWSLQGKAEKGRVCEHFICQSGARSAPNSLLSAQQTHPGTIGSEQPAPANCTSLERGFTLSGLSD